MKTEDLVTKRLGSEVSDISTASTQTDVAVFTESEDDKTMSDIDRRLNATSEDDISHTSQSNKVYNDFRKKPCNKGCCHTMQRRNQHRPVQNNRINRTRNTSCDELLDTVHVCDIENDRQNGFPHGSGQLLDNSNELLEGPIYQTSSGTLVKVVPYDKRCVGRINGLTHCATESAIHAYAENQHDCSCTRLKTIHSDLTARTKHIDASCRKMPLNKQKLTTVLPGQRLGCLEQNAHSEQTRHTSNEHVAIDGTCTCRCDVSCHGNNVISNDMQETGSNQPFDCFSSMQSNDDSAYEAIRTSKTNRKRKYSCSSKNSRNCKFYKQWFYILLAFNVSILLLNTVGLPLAFSSTSEHESLCFDCVLLENVSIDDKTFDLTRKGNRCCLSSNDGLFELMSEVSNARCTRINNTNITDKETPVLHLNAEGVYTHKDGKQPYLRVAWRNNTDVQQNVDILDNQTLITIRQTGYYFIYSRLSFKRKSDDTNRVSIENKIKLLRSPAEADLKDTTIASTDLACIPGGNSTTTVHSSIMQFIHHFRRGESFYMHMRIKHQKYFDKSNSYIGLFVLST